MPAELLLTKSKVLWVSRKCLNKNIQTSKRNTKPLIAGIPFFLLKTVMTLIQLFFHDITEPNHILLSGRVWIECVKDVNKTGFLSGNEYWLWV